VQSLKAPFDGDQQSKLVNTVNFVGRISKKDFGHELQNNGQKFLLVWNETVMILVRLNLEYRR
jgi:hypothetical protein